MTTTTPPTAPTPDLAATDPAPPYTRAIQVAAGTCLVLAGLLNGLPQYVGSQLTGDLDFSDQIVWGTTHELAHRSEQSLILLSSLFLPLGLLGLAQVTRWYSRRLTLVAAPLVLWGMWGFHNVLAFGYVSGTIAPTVLPVADAVTLNDALVSDPGSVAMALVPHLVGSFFGLLLLMVAAWRTGVLPRAACALVVAFLVRDFLLPTAGPAEPHLLLAVGFVWLGIRVGRLAPREWAPRPY